MYIYRSQRALLQLLSNVDDSSNYNSASQPARCSSNGSTCSSNVANLTTTTTQSLNALQPAQCSSIHTMCSSNTAQSTTTTTRLSTAWTEQPCELPQQTTASINCQSADQALSNLTANKLALSSIRSTERRSKDQSHCNIVVGNTPTHSTETTGTALQIIDR